MGFSALIAAFLVSGFGFGVMAAEQSPAATASGAPAAPLPPPVPAAAIKATEPAAGLEVQLMGYAALEYEDSKRFGYDGTSGQANFTDVPGYERNLGTFLSNIQFDISKRATKLTTVLEVGELIDGDSSSGGAQGARSKIVEVRNIYLQHRFSDNISFRGGLLPISSDPNNFIMSDHYAAAVGEYDHPAFFASLWMAKAYDNKPALSKTSTSPAYVSRDQYIGLQMQPKWGDDLKLTAYYVSRKTNEDFYDESISTVVSGRSSYDWLGLTFNHKINDMFGYELTAIGNQLKFRSETEGSSASDSQQAYLADVKLIGKYDPTGTGFTLEGLKTSGSSDSVATGQTKQTVGMRKNFSSPDPGCAYVLTIATSDGADDAPGSPKESVISNLSQNEGVQIIVAKLSQSFTDQWDGFVRYGLVDSTAKSLATDSNHLGYEVDVNTTFKLSPETLLQLDGSVYFFLSGLNSEHRFDC